MRTKPAIGRAFVAAWAMTVLLGLSGSAAAKPPAPEVDLEAQAQAIEALVQELEGQGATQQAIDRAIRREFGYLRADVPSDEPVIVPMGTTQNHATIALPKVYKSATGPYWYVQASFAWKSTCGTFGNMHCWYLDCLFQGDCGGPDGFGVRVYPAVDDSSTTFSTYNEVNQATTWSGPDELNQYGTAWVTTDRLTASDIISGRGIKYNWHKGTIYWYFKPITCTGKQGTAWKFYSRLFHSWDTTAITGISIGSVGISASTSGGGSYWPLGTATPVNAYLCG